MLLGDYNVIPEPVDAKNPQAWTEDALFQPETRAAYRALLNLGLVDAVRACHPTPGSTRSGTTRPAPGRRTTASASTTSWLSPQAADRLVAAGVDKFTRGWEKPSDHVPVWIELARLTAQRLRTKGPVAVTATS